VLTSFITLSPLLPQLLGNEKVCVWATDEEKYILFKDHADLGLPIEEGTLLSSEGTPMLAMERRGGCISHRYRT
jgi:hypothetical protein